MQVEVGWYRTNLAPRPECLLVACSFLQGAPGQSRPELGEVESLLGSRAPYRRAAGSKAGGDTDSGKQISNLAKARLRLPWHEDDYNATLFQYPILPQTFMLYGDASRSQYISLLEYCFIS